MQINYEKVVKMMCSIMNMESFSEILSQLVFALVSFFVILSFCVLFLAILFDFLLFVTLWFSSYSRNTFYPTRYFNISL